MLSVPRSYVTLLVVAALLLGSCNSNKTSAEPLRVGLNPWAGFGPLYAAAERGLYKPVRVELATFSTFYDIHRAFHLGNLEIAGVPLFDAVQMLDEGEDLKVIMVTDYSNGADALVTHKSIATMKDLRGKRVAVEEGTLPHFLVLRALERSGMKESDVVLVNMPAEQAVEEFKQGKVDAAEVWEPYLSKLRGADTHTVFTTAEVPAEVPDVIVVRRDVLERRRDDVLTILRAWNKALEIWKTTPGEIEGLMARTMSMSPEELKTGAEGIVFTDFPKNLELLDRSRREQSIWKTYDLTINFMTARKLFKSSPRPPEDILDMSVVAEAAKN